MKFKKEVRNLSYINRWAITRTIRNQSVADHSFYVAIIADYLAQCLPVEYDREAYLSYAIYHDLDEITTGDIPSPVKRANPSIKKTAPLLLKEFFGIEVNEPDPDTKKLVKLADMVEGACFLIEEMRMGNLEAGENMKKIVKESYIFLEKNWGAKYVPIVQEIYETMEQPVSIVK